MQKDHSIKVGKNKFVHIHTPDNSSSVFLNFKRILIITHYPCGEYFALEIFAKYLKFIKTDRAGCARPISLYEL